MIAQVEHIRVLEEAQRFVLRLFGDCSAADDLDDRLQNAEISRMKLSASEREAKIRTLEQARKSLTQSLEDVSPSVFALYPCHC